MSKASDPSLVDRNVMRKLTLLLFLAAFALPAIAVKLVTVQHLEQAVAEARSKADKDIAQQLTKLELTERLSTARLDKLKAELPGDQSRKALLAVADASAFLNLPAADILHDPPPDSATQGKIMSLAADFVVATLPKMPDFFATRTTTRFNDMRVEYLFGEPNIVQNDGFHLVDKFSDTVLFRDGRELVQATTAKKGEISAPPQTGLANWGVFGPLLGIVMTDVLKGKMGWGHWEQGATGPLAVFRYAVAEGKSGYTVRYCCFQSDGAVLREFKAVPPYHGEITIDPATGAVLRLVVNTDLKPGPQIFRADLLVEYSAVEIGGKSYICPARSISISKAIEVVSREVASPDGKATYTVLAGMPDVTSINDVVFDNYHQFRGEMRILPADNADPNISAPSLQPAAPSASPPPQR
jgi:hypothetical protein